MCRDKQVNSQLKLKIKRKFSRILNFPTMQSESGSTHIEVWNGND